MREEFFAPGGPGRCTGRSRRPPPCDRGCSPPPSSRSRAAWPDCMPWNTSWWRRAPRDRPPCPARWSRWPEAGWARQVCWSIPLAQFSLSTICVASSGLPLVRSSTYRKPLRLACSSSLRVCPFHSRVHQHNRLVGVPVVQIVRSELEVPQQLAGLGVDAPDRCWYTGCFPARSSPSVSGWGLPTGQ